MGKVGVKCGYCKKVFYDYLSNNKKYCSKKCYHKSMLGNVPWNKGTKGKMKAWNKGKKLSKEHIKKLKEAKLKNPVRYWLNKERPRGKDSANWRGGISRDKQSLSNPKYKEWRDKVFKRDDYTCKGCGIKGCQSGGYLEAHHIKSWAKYPNLRFNIKNGLTLCIECHKLTDNYKGKGNRQNCELL